MTCRSKPEGPFWTRPIKKRMSPGIFLYRAMAHGTRMGGGGHRGGALLGADVAFNALHGEFGEDGTVQRLLGQLGISYTGSNAAASATAFHKPLTKPAPTILGI